MHDNIGMFPTRDPRNFPQWVDKAPPGHSGSEYPKMLTRHCTREDREAWLIANKKIDIGTKDVYYDGVAPRLGSQIPYVATAEMIDAGWTGVVGDVVIVNDADEERHARQFLEPRDPVAIPVAAGDASKPHRRLRSDEELIDGKIVRRKTLR